MNWLDVVLIIPLLWFTYKGFRNGFVVELASLAALILGIIIALQFSFYTEALLREYFDISDQYLYILSFAITFILVALLVFLAGKIIHKLVNIIALGFLNRLAGALFGLLKTALVLSVIIYFLNGFDTGSSLIKPETKENSQLYDPIESIVPLIIPKLRIGNLEIPGTNSGGDKQVI